MEGLSDQVLASMERHALLNAVRHGGKAEVGAVMSKVLGEDPSLRSRARDVAIAAGEVVRRVNGLPPDEQQRLLGERYPGSLEEPKREGRVGLPPLEGAVRGKVVLRLPPEPSGFMHIGHAMAGTINAIYRDEYDGKLWLRFEDTNPRKVQKRYYESFRRGYAWLGIRWDEEKNVSSDMEALYDRAGGLLERGQAYACACPMERVKKLRFEGQACEHREASTEKNLDVWEGMLSRRYKEGEYVVRLRGDLSSLDYSLRDPNIVRVIDYPHPVTGGRYSVWPTYDFEVVVEDDLCGVTHVLRSSEFHVGLQDLIRGMLSLPQVNVRQFSRFNFKGTPVQKRLLRPLVEEKVVKGWDDPRMPTMEGVMRRGIVPESIRQFTAQVGYTKSEHVYDWSLLFAVNRKVLDPLSRRLYFVPEGTRLRVEGAPAKVATIPFHPDGRLGSREIATKGEFYVPSRDIEAMREGDIFRLMELYNVRLTSRGTAEATASFEGTELIQESRKIQWVPVGSARQIEVLEPSELYDEAGMIRKDSLRTRKGHVEESFSSLAEGDIVQFPRYGFVRVDGPGRCVLAHP